MFDNTRLLYTPRDDAAVNAKTSSDVPRTPTTRPARNHAIEPGQTLEDKVHRLEQQTHDLQISKNKKEIREVEMKKEKKLTATLIHGDDEDTLELSIAQRNFDNAQSKMQDAQREVQEAIYMAEVAKIKLEAAKLDNTNAAAKVELAKRLMSLGPQVA